MKVVFLLPQSMRKELRKPFGTIFENLDALLNYLSFEDLASRLVVSVGDIVTKSLLSKGVKPRVGIIDGRTMREPIDWSWAKESFDNIMEVENPPSHITEDLWRAIERALEIEGKTLILVRGEEDLAVLPATMLLPENAIILYGQPEEGVVLLEVTRDKKREALSILRKMEVRKWK